MQLFCLFPKVFEIHEILHKYMYSNKMIRLERCRLKNDTFEKLMFIKIMQLVIIICNNF